MIRQKIRKLLKCTVPKCRYSGTIFTKVIQKRSCSRIMSQIVSRGGVRWNGVEWSGVSWSGVDLSGVEWGGGGPGLGWAGQGRTGHVLQKRPYDRFALEYILLSATHRARLGL